MGAECESFSGEHDQGFQIVREMIIELSTGALSHAVIQARF